MEIGQARPRTISVIIESANPFFILIAMGLPIGLLIYAVNFGSIISLNFVHIMTGALWVGIDLYLGFVLGPVLGSMAPEDRARVFMRLVPKMTFLMPVLAAVAITSGIQLAQRMGHSLDNPLMVAAVVIVSLLTIQGFGILLPNEVRVFRQLLSREPDIGKISQLGMINAKLGGVQGLFQIAIIVIMAMLRF